MDTKKILKSNKLYCKAAGHKVDMKISRQACAMRNKCADPTKCPLYVERLIKESAR